MTKSLENIINWEACRTDEPMQECINIVNLLNANGFQARYRVTERDSFGPLCVLISATKDGELYEYLY